MKVIDQSWSWEQCPSNVLETLERAARTCYKSEDKIANGSAERLIKSCIKRGHESVLEHVSVSVRIITSRGISHELVRHRLCSFSQESTRYVKYDGDMEFIRPVWMYDPNTSSESKDTWLRAMKDAEDSYKELLGLGLKPQDARGVLPNDVKTELVMTANLREWRTIFKLRCDKAAHPDMRRLMVSLLKGFAGNIPVVFDDLYEIYVIVV